MPRLEAQADGHTLSCWIRWKPIGWVAYLHRPDCRKLYVTPLPEAPVAKADGATDPFNLLSCGGFEAHTNLRNGCRRHPHCECVCDPVPWHAQRARSWVSVCELLVHLSP